MNILITGGASGLGEAITRKLASDSNSNIFITFPNELLENSVQLKIVYPNVFPIKCNFSNNDELDFLTEKMDVMNLDVLINNSIFSMLQNHFHKIKVQQFIDSFHYNVVPVIKITKKAITIFRKKRFGKIINILTSSLINKPPAGYSEYTANKAYIQQLSKSWATENANFNITSNCISPSFMKTYFTSSTDERIIDELTKSHPLKKILTPEEVADSVHYLVNCPQHINGINLVINSAENIV